jgi:formyl-CoA transferase
VDLATDAGRAVFFRLVEQADVVVENFRPGVKERLGVDPDAVWAVNPRVVYASISGFGQDGPYATRPGVDQIAQGLGGLMSVTGPPGSGPWRVGIAISDTAAGTLLTQGVLAALIARDRTGRGQWVHTSLLEAMIYMMDFQTARWTIEGEIPQQAGNFHPTSIPTGVYRTKDGHINIAVFGGKIWERFCHALGAPEWIADERSATKVNRSVHRDWLNAEIEEKLAAEGSDYWIEKLNQEGVACGRINNLAQVFEEPQVQHLGMLKTVVSPRLGEQKLVGQPVNLSRTPSTIARATPRRGEHSEEILSEIGYDGAALARMKAAGVF